MNFARRVPDNFHTFGEYVTMELVRSLRSERYRRMLKKRNSSVHRANC